MEAYCQCTLLESSEEAPVPSPSKGPSASFKQESPCKDSPQKMEQSSSDYRPSSTSAEEDSSYEEESSYEEDCAHHSKDVKFYVLGYLQYKIICELLAT